jgi:hypothetical protein
VLFHHVIIKPIKGVTVDLVVLIVQAVNETARLDPN